MANNNINRIVGRNLKTLREANQYTQEQLAAFLGIQRSAYVHYETGSREAPIKLLEKASNLMGCELMDLYDEEGKALKDLSICSFRTDQLNESDLNEVAAFKNIVKNYLKMTRLAK